MGETQGVGLRLVFMGTPAFAAAILEHALRWEGGRVVGVYAQPDRPCGRGLERRPPDTKVLALGHGLPVLQPLNFKTPEARAELAALRPDLLLVAAYGLILPQAVLDIPRLGAVNVHASLLPKYRGAAPIQRALMAGETVTGVSIMQMDAGLDTGDVLLARELPIGPEDTAASLHDSLADLGGRALLEALDLIAAGRSQRAPQDPAQATYAPKLRKDEGGIDWSRPAAEIHDRVRGVHPWPGAYFFWDSPGRKKPLRLGLAPGRPGGPRPLDAAPGTILGEEDGMLAIACADRTYLTPAVTPEGRKRIGAAAFVCGYLCDAPSPSAGPDCPPQPGT
ncbi:MAG: methionyl-tRNA formyltransferase [Thermodesulfobacteriota bacterium]